MLDNEPDTNQSTNAEPSPPATPPRRRRAASRPAGPPTTAGNGAQAELPAHLDPEPVQPAPQVASQAEVPAPDEAQQEVIAPEHAQSETVAPEVLSAAGSLNVPPVEAAADADVVPVKRAPRKRTAKKAVAAPEAPELDLSSGPVSEPEAAGLMEDEPKQRAPRKRAPRKVTEPAVPVEVEHGAAVTAVAERDGGATQRPAGWDTSAEPVRQEGSEVPPTLDGSVDPAGQDSSVVEPDDLDLDQSETDRPEAPKPDYGWLADPFAVPVTPPVSPADGSEATGASTTTGEPDAVVDAEDNDDAEESADGNRRRRRRRGGRRRRRGGSDSEGTDSSDGPDSSDGADSDGADFSGRVEDDSELSDSDDEDDASDDRGSDSAGDEGRVARPSRSRRQRAGRVQVDENDDALDARSDDAQPDLAGADGAQREESTANDEDDGDESEGQRRRRRRRRRRGEEAASLPDDPSDVVVRVREPRARQQQRSAASEEVTGIQGSTRMEAKRQRRKEGRDAGRRRVPILSEAEFLARRESVIRKMVIRQRRDLTQIAVLEDGILVEHYVDRDSAASLIGNVYLGRVQNVLPSMEAAFIDIGRGRNAVLYAGEVDWDSFGAEGQGRKVEKVLKSGQTILVQVTKDPVGAKGARLTNHVSIPGRYIVYAPGGHLSGISRKLPDVERKRLKDILADLVGDSASVIVRTAAEGASEEELVRDVNRLKAQWEDIERKVKAGSAPQLLYGEPDLTVRIVRDLFTEDFSDLVVQGNDSMNDAYDSITGYVTHVAPHLQDRIRRWTPAGEADLFSEYRLDEQIAKALERKVFLPSGGSLVIDRTEAMTVIDVNTGKFTGTGGNLEATVTSNNLEAAEEIVRQLRLRDIGGIIVVDFIDMVLPNNRELLLRRLVECLGRDRTRHQVAEVTSLGLVQMTRKKIGTGLLEAFGTECPTCQGRGYEIHDLPVDSQQQADGGARDQRPGAHRPRPGDHVRGDQSSSRSGRQDRALGQGSSQAGQSGDAETNGSTAPVDNEVSPTPVSGGPPEPADQQERPSRSRRDRRSRGSSLAEDDHDELPSPTPGEAEGDRVDVAVPVATGDPGSPEPSRGEPHRGEAHDAASTESDSTPGEPANGLQPSDPQPEPVTSS